MMELKEYKFSDLYEMSSGISSTKEQAGHGAPFASFSTVFNNYILPDELPDLMDVSEREKKTYSIKKGDILITRTSETLDELAMSSVALKDYPEATYSGFVKRLRPLQTDVTYDKFMAFYLRSPYFRKIVDNNTNMTLRASFNEDIFSYLTILLPEYKEQKRIGDFLFLIFEKIKTNTSLIEKLEEEAYFLYDYWFLQYEFPNDEEKNYKSSGGSMCYDKDLEKEVPSGWNKGNLYDIADFINGLACQKYRPVDESKKLPVIKIKEMQDGIGKDTEYVKEDIPSKNIINDGDILFSWSASLLVQFWAGGKCGLNQHIFKVVEKEPYSHYYVYLQLNSYIINFIQLAAARKTTMGHITSEHLQQSKILLPPEKILEKFDKIITPMYDEVIKLKQENLKLEELTNFLLQMLINGQVRIGETNAE